MKNGGDGELQRAAVAAKRNLHLTFTTESTDAVLDDDRFSFVIIHLGFYSLLNRDDSIPQNSGTLVLLGFLFCAIITII